MLKVLSLIFLVSLIYSCSESVETLDNLKGLEETEVVSKYGSPESVNSYNMNDDIVLLEINGRLLSYFPADSSIQIRDMVWNKVGYTIKVWFHESDSKLEVIDAIKYKDSVIF